MTSSDYDESKTLFWQYHLKIWTVPIITMRSAHVKKTIFIHLLENLCCPCNHELKYLQRYPRFNEAIWKFELSLYHELKFLLKKNSFDDVTWKFELVLLLLANIFSNIRQFCLFISKIWSASIFTSWNFRKNKAVLTISLENLHCPYYHELTFSQK